MVLLENERDGWHGREEEEEVMVIAPECCTLHCGCGFEVWRVEEGKGWDIHDAPHNADTCTTWVL